MAAVAPARLQLHGERETGEDVRTQNVVAVSAIANIVKSSLGPVGLDKVGKYWQGIGVIKGNFW